jgi:predicted adenylyl cyclase CyaB
MTEIEVRAILEDPTQAQRRLLEMNFTEETPYEQWDIMLDRPDASLFRSGQKIRIRAEKGRAELTYKGLFQGDASASRRTEINLEIEPAQIEKYVTLFEALGFPLCFQIRKQRKIFKSSSAKVSFDDWPLIGCLVEVEGSEENVKTVASQMAPSVTFKNYRLKELLKNLETKTGRSIAELKAEYIGQTGFDLGKIELLAD